MQATIEVLQEDGTLSLRVEKDGHSHTIHGYYPGTPLCQFVVDADMAAAHIDARIARMAADAV